eukprot:TRINITY_DN1156_c0_g1_i5.p1 TRINITY_DN1156_c0_g1~~TRINITY_DN1156_c0_g1_i5.p1  ORF type:complete len:110 (-),score=42.88 TRINITY_DN1156_c0_g1_i5:109-438(-)
MPAPAPAPAPMMAPSSGGGIMSGILSGMTFGVGSSLGHRAVDSVLGPRTVHHEHSDAAAPEPAQPAPMQRSMACNEQLNAFQDCLRSNSGNLSSCQMYYDLLQSCQRDQ